LRVPRFSKEAISEQGDTEQKAFTKKDLAIAGVGGLAVNGLILAAGKTGKTELATASLLVDAPLIAYLGYRASKVLGPLRLRS
jgi:hypothetical protein